ncbi:TPA: PKD domain-containing protein, partial [archaeon]|nr:PKD domain-containing protein [Candidatus Naiadarchaeales archaeon SRR2090153.bin1042]
SFAYGRSADGADVICLVNVPCNIDGSGSTDPDPEDVNLLTYLWDFGDGTIQEAGISVGHTFTTPGTYTITLTVTDPGNAFSIDSAEIIVEANPGVDPQSPLAVIDAYPTSGTVPLVVSFDASGSSDPDNEIVSYDWDFGDGELGNGITTTHTYTSSGSYIVFLTATDATGQIGTTVIQIAVGEADLDEPYIDPTPELGGELVDVTLTGGFGAGTGGFGSGPPIFPTQPRIGDTDGDLIPDNLDACPGTSPSETVTANGCPLGSAPAKATCTPDDFKRERVLIGVDVSSIANSCGLSGNWKVDIFRTEPTNVEVASSTASAQTISIPDIFGTIPNVPSSIDISSFALPPPRDSCSQIVPGWRAGVDVHRVYCGIDNQWYYVSYAASFKQE